MTASFIAVPPAQADGAAEPVPADRRSPLRAARRALRAAAGDALRDGAQAVALVSATAVAAALLAPPSWGALLAIACVLAMALAALLAPAGPHAAAVAALPVTVPIAQALLQADAAAAPYALAAAGAGAALAVWHVLHRRWQLAALARIGCEQRLAALEAERDAARRADADKTRFLAIASHDLRQPVHALGLFGATLEQQLHGTPHEPLMRNLTRALDGLDRSLTAMLDVSRLDAGTVAPSLQHFPLRDLFRRLHMQFAGQAELAGLGLRFSPGGKTVTSDPQLLERMLANLIQNALKHTERGGAAVVARTTATHIHVEVWDTGCGIAPENLPRVFGEFYQVGRSERDRTRGLGMGLAIVARLARLLGHTLEVASRPGRGTMFRIGIPLGGLAEMADGLAPADTLPGLPPEARNVLVIEDEPAIREGLRTLLEQWGYQAAVAASVDAVPQAVAELNGAVDLIVSDLHLGDDADGRDGLHAIDLARRLAGAQAPAVLISGDTGAQQIRRIAESGHRVLFKPVQPRKLLALLQGMSKR